MDGTCCGGIWEGAWKALPGLCCRTLLSASTMISVSKETHEEDLGQENRREWDLSGRMEEGRIHGLVSQPWEGVKLLYC